MVNLPYCCIFAVPTVPDIKVTDKDYMCNFTHDDCGLKDTASHRGKWLRTLVEKTESKCITNKNGYKYERANYVRFIPMEYSLIIHCTRP